MHVFFLLHYAVFVLFVFLSLFLVSGVCVLQCGKIEERLSELRELNTFALTLQQRVNVHCNNHLIILKYVKKLLKRKVSRNCHKRLRLL